MSNREVILECALDLFYKRGYDAVGVQEIVDAAGITKPTLYHYFKSKYGLLESLVEDGCGNLCGMIEEISMKSKEDLPKVLFNVAREYISFGTSNTKLLNMILSMQYSAKESESHKAVAPYTTRLFNSMIDIFNNAKAMLGNMNGRQEQFAIGFLGILNHFLIVKCEKNEGKDSFLVNDREVFLLVHQFMYGIYS